MPARTAFPPPAPTTQPDGDVRPASTTEPRDPQSASPEPQPAQSSEDAGDLSPTEVALEAYARYVDRGRVDGHDVEDWLAAEEALRRRSRNRT